MGTLYWAIVVLFLGACIGSFLNVVIFRWPRGLSTRSPARSFCPGCGASIAWYDNLPIVSYIALAARCRHCRAPIALQYPLVEAATALVFLMTYDAFFVAGERMGVTAPSVDWPMLVAHWILWGGLLALSVMDLEAYMVDIRITWIVSAAGIVAHTLWTPASSADWIRPGPLSAAFCMAATAGLGIGAVLFLRRPPEPPMQDELPEHAPSPVVEGAGHGRTLWLWLLIPVVLLIAYVVLIAVAPQPVEFAPPGAQFDAGMPAERVPPMTPGTLRLAGGLALTFLGLALVASIPHVEADADIVQAIEEESISARREAVRELVLISPAILLAVAVVLLFAVAPEARAKVQAALDWAPVGEWRPLLGVSTGIAGWLIGGAVGWLARIVFTLMFGKEALGMGDVHILAAAGAVAGWPVAFLGFFMAAPLTLLALIVIHFRRQSRALPYGPWLALAFFVASIFQDRILLYFGVRWML